MHGMDLFDFDIDFEIDIMIFFRYLLILSLGC